ncbi:Cytochrome P450 2D11 [Folsomia candida]|uniref:Cytochrome P450 2D11 n=1 Tax=Folsomia candida TaxID=158441 RepID=A0A226DUN6_FOLCA|nr:Cytochrome P450 2D11 [Folsomia candida]
MQSILSNEAALGRDVTGIFADRCGHQNLGITMSEGEIWEKTRTWTFKTLSKLGCGNARNMENYIRMASESIFAQIDDSIMARVDIEVDKIFQKSILSMTWLMIVGKLSPEDGPDIELLSDKGRAFMESSFFGAGITNVFPILRFIFPHWLGYNVQMDFFTTCNKIAKNLFLEGKAKQDLHRTPEEAKNFVDLFSQNCNSDPKTFNCENFQLIFQDLLLGSTDTTSSHMEAAFLHLVTFPEIQEKIYREILQVSGEGKPLNFSDRNSMPYIQAFLHETHRMSRIAQNLGPRRVLRDLKYKEFTIKKDTVILPDTRLYCEDKIIWQDPENFRPERFNNSDGELVNTEKMITFSFGKRACPGERQANILSFLLLTSILQRYKLSLPEGETKPRLDMKLGFSQRPYPFKIRCTWRKEFVRDYLQ